MYLDDLSSFLLKQKKGYVGMVVVERNMPPRRNRRYDDGNEQDSVVHTHLQVIPLYSTKQHSSLSSYVSSFSSLTSQDTFQFHKLNQERNQLVEEVVNGSDFFVQFRFLPLSPSDEDEVSFVFDFNSSSSSAVLTPYYPREVCCRLMGVEERSNWKVCTLDQSQEEDLTTKFRDEFQPFDHTLKQQEEQEEEEEKES